MIDARLLRQSASDVAKNLARRNFTFDADAYLVLEEQRKAFQIEVESFRAERNASAKNIGKAKAHGEDVEPLLAAVKDLGDRLDAAEVRLQVVQSALTEIEMGLPNLLHDDVPDGCDETGNREISKWGDLPEFNFKPLDHVDLGHGLGLLDFAAASRISGSRFSVLHGPLARLQRALIQFMLDTHTRAHGYEEVYVPYLVQADALLGTGQLPKFAADLFKTTDDPPFYLIPTAEVPVTNLVRDEIIAGSRLPLKYVCHSPCFRSEAGSYGKDTKGLIRQHQFEKVELVKYCLPENSVAEHEILTDNAEKILRLLRLPYRKVILSTGDLGFGSHKTYDLEVWLPGQNKYREISSCSNMTDFQARRMKARWRNPETGKPELVHTLNGSGLAIGRALIAVMENYQQADGSIRIPDLLQPYMHGMTEIRP